MSQPSENPSSAPAAPTRDPRLPHDAKLADGRLSWWDLRGGEHSLTEEDYFYLLELQQAAAEAEPSCASNRHDMRIPPQATLERGSISWLDAGGRRCCLREEGYYRLFELQHASGALRVASQRPPAEEPAPGTSRTREGAVSPCAGRDLPRSGASPDGPRPLPAQGLTQGQAAPDPFEPIRKFGLAARVRFLDCLAGHGEVRAAAARVGISHETAYRARRRWPDFAQLWDAALVHARTRAESELGTRALDGVEVPVFQRGEQVGAWRRHDARYLLAHLARLDRHVEANPDAVKRAERFDEMLAAMAGHELPEHFAEACPKENIEGVPPARDAFVEHVCGQALDELGENGEEIFEGEEERVAAEAEAVEWATTEAGAEHDLWVDGAFAKLDGVLEGEDECESEEAAEDASAGDVPLIEYKAIMSGSALRAKLRRGVSHVSTGGPPSFVIPAKAGTQLQSAPTGSPLSRG